MAAGRQAVEAELAVGAAGGPAPEIRERDPDVPQRLALLVGDLATGAVHLEHGALGGVGHLRADRLRTDFRPALAHRAGLDRQAHDVVERHLVLAADRAPEVGLLPLPRPDGALDRPRRRAVREPAVELVLRDLGI